MRKVSLNQDAEYLKNEQYQDSGNLNARAELHRRFSSNKSGWHPWVFQQLALTPNCRVLECGCGPGWLWRDQLDRLPAGCTVTLTDFSPGMVAEAEKALASAGHNFHFETADIQSLRFEDDSFDVVVANHMLYHVPDRAKALAEVRRVTRPEGRFIAATNGQDHMRQLGEFSQILLPDNQHRTLSKHREQVSAAFSLENGREQLTLYFSQVSLYLFQDSLEVTEAAPLLAYAASMMGGEAILTDELKAMAARWIEAEIEKNGAIHITKSSGLFIIPPPIPPTIPGIPGIPPIPDMKGLPLCISYIWRFCGSPSV